MQQLLDAVKQVKETIQSYKSSLVRNDLGTLL